MITAEDIKQIKQIIAESVSVPPIGAIYAFPTAKIPEGYLLCDGKEYAVSDYPRLYKVLGNTYGGIQDATFCVPNYMGMFLRSLDLSNEIDPGRTVGDLQKDALQGHRHKVTDVDGHEEIYTDLSGEHNHTFNYRRENVGTWGGEKWTVDEIKVDSSMIHNVSVSAEGKHRHQLSIRVGDAVPSSYGMLRQAVETRPINVTVVYAILAENVILPSSGEAAYNDLCRRLSRKNKALLGQYSKAIPVPESEEEYQKCIEQIKNHYFKGQIFDSFTDLLFNGIACFQDMTSFNVRVGRWDDRNGLDEEGLFLLSSWIHDNFKDLYNLEMSKESFTKAMRNYVWGDTGING